MSNVKCFLKSVGNNHEPVELIHGRELIFGRGPESRIYENRCSRRQIKIVADCVKREAKVTQLGRNASGINGMSICKDQTVTVNEGDRIELLLGQFIYVIEFDPPVEISSYGRKRRLPTTESSECKVIVLSDSEEELEPSEPKSRKSDASANVSKEVWESVDDDKLLVYTHPGIVHSTRIASYDLDGTLIGTKSGGIFPKHKDDWKILYPSVLTKLKEMHDNKFKIVIFTNQSSLSSGKTNEKNFKSKIENIVRKMNVPIQVFIATGYSYYRKPAIGMWDALKERNGGLEIEIARSFYCGDAAGREAGPSQKKKDFAHSDLLFARNLDLSFETPEHHFLKKEMQPLKITVFDPKAIPCDVPLCTPPWGQVISNKLELIILVGCPGAGKSHFVNTHLIPAGYVHVNRDTLGSWNKCVSVMETALKSKQKVVVDNTNPDVESRKRYITIAKNYTNIVRCFIMNTSFLHAKHNNKFRQLVDPSHAVISDLVMNTYKSKYKEPKLDEGFTEILRINFWPTFKDAKQEKLYKLFLLEK